MVVASPFVSPRVRELLAEAGAGWFDTTGNMRVQAERPALFLQRSGADRSPYREPADWRLRTLKGPKAARVVRSLLDGGGQIGVRALAERAGVGAATGVRVVDLLTREGLVWRGDDGSVTRVFKHALLRAWTREYDLVGSNSVVPALAPRGIGRVLEDLHEYDHRYALTGSAALRAYLPDDRLAVTPLSLLQVYVDDIGAPLRDLQVRSQERGANMMLIVPFDEVVYDRGATVDGLRYVSSSQTAADLMTSPGRGPEEAEQLLAVLAQQEGEWSE